VYLFYLITACAGGTLLVLQFLLGLVGLGGDHDTDIDHDIDHDIGHDLGHDLGHDAQGGNEGAGHEGATWLFHLLSLRTIAAGLTFFGLTGLTAWHFGRDSVTTLLLAVAAGGGALVLVALILRGFRQLQEDGTLRIRRAIGVVGTVYLRVPGQRSGTGKITVKLQNRSVELLAMTSGEELPTNSRAVVVGVVSSDTVEVAPVPESAEAPAHA
jgi:hypothetical protein